MYNTQSWYSRLEFNFTVSENQQKCKSNNKVMKCHMNCFINISDLFGMKQWEKDSISTSSYNANVEWHVKLKTLLQYFNSTQAGMFNTTIYTILIFTNSICIYTLSLSKSNYIDT